MMNNKTVKEQIVVSLTTWAARIGNIPTVLDSIYAQTVLPDFVVLNLAYDEAVPENVADYIESRGIIVNRVEDTKVYKKLWPTLKLFPDACVITIDDDFLYPPEMIEDFVTVHRRHPGSPISGNRVCEKFVKCHCGCASLTKKEYFGAFFNFLDEDVIRNCSSDDLVYTYFIQRNGRRYRQTEGEYFLNMIPVNSTQPYSKNEDMGIDNTWRYLINRFGPIGGVNRLRILFARAMAGIQRLCN